MYMNIKYNKLKIIYLMILINTYKYTHIHYQLPIIYKHNLIYYKLIKVM